MAAGQFVLVVLMALDVKGDKISKINSVSLQVLFALPAAILFYHGFYSCRDF